MTIEAKLDGTYRWRMLVMGIVGCGFGALVLYLVSRGYVKTLDDEGVTTRAGKRHLWSDLKQVKPVYTHLHGSTHLNHVDLRFHTGKAGVYHIVLENGIEVLAFVRRKTGHPIPLSA